MRRGVGGQPSRRDITCFSQCLKSPYALTSHKGDKNPKKAVALRRVALIRRVSISIKKVSTLAITALSVFLLGVTSANASVIFVFEGTSAGSVAGTTNFTYDVNFQTNTSTGSTTPNDRFVGDGTTYGTIYDVVGFVNAVLNPMTSPFTVTSSLLGRTPIGIAPTDSASITNVTVTYTGPTLTTDMSFPLVLVVTSTASGQNNLGQYSGQDIKNAGGAVNTVSTNFGFITVPASAVPEPGSIYAFAGGIGLLLIGRIRRRKSN